MVTLRARLGLTHTDVASHLQTVGRAYYAVENGRAPLHDADDRQRLADLLQVDLAEVTLLLGGGEPSQ
ncbi:helix-turn-helix domain-containing protein [Plantactinospora sp. DSM 117369]